jgi:hypothetical protein
MYQQRNINKKYLDPNEKGQIVDQVNAQLILPDPHRAQGIDQKVKHQECAYGKDTRQGMQLEQKKMRSISCG